MLAAPAFAQPAPNARPMGGQVSAGQASISQSPTTTTVTQSSNRAAVNWQSFDVGAQQTVQFVQPSSTATTLNRVLSPDPSQIAGRITANGQIVIQNQSGVVFAKGAQVNAAGLVVSAPGITDQNFMAGKMVFDVPAKPDARIVNNGTITVQQSGLAALVAPQVANNGVITAKMGHVVLAGAETQTVDLYGDGMVSINVTGQVTQAPVGPDGKPVTALVTNSGVVAAAGGTVELTARAVDGIVQTLVTAGGHISADTVGGHTGKIVVSGVGGSVIVEGDVSAAGVAAGTTGGAIGINATGGVTVAAGAHVSASGTAGGGTIAIGTTLARARGGPSVASTHTAANTTIAKGAVITADATQKGNGGTIVLLSTQSTAMGGAISARGGPLGGNGGHVEVSGETGFALTGTVDVTARTATGLVGTILIDPRDLYISDTNPVSDNEAAGDTTLTSGSSASSPTSLPGSSTDAWITPASINNLSGAVTLTATRDLDVLSALNTTGSGITSLDLTAGRNLVITAALTTGGDLKLYAGNSLDSSAAITAGGNVELTNLYSAGIPVSGFSNAMTLLQPVTAGTGKRISLAVATSDQFDQLIAPQGTVEKGPATAATANNFGLAIGSSGNAVIANTVRVGTTSMPNALVAKNITFGDASNSQLNNYGSATLDLHATGAVTQYTGSSLQAGAITGSVGSLTLANTGNTIGSIGTLTATGAVTLMTGGPLSLTGTLTADSLSLTTPGAVTQTVGSTVSVSTLTGSVGSLDLPNPTNSIGTVGPLTATGAITLADSEALTFDGTLAASTLNLATTGVVSQTAASVMNVGTLTGTVGTLDLYSGTNNIGSIGPLTSSNLLELYNAQPLTIGGTLTANYILLTATGAMTLAADLVLVASNSQPDDSAGHYYPNSAFLVVIPDGGGAASFAQTGTSHVSQQGGESTELYVYVYGPGNVTFNDLEAPGSNFYVFGDGGALTGQINVANMFIYNDSYCEGCDANTEFYHPGTSLYTGTGSSAFTNSTVGGLTGGQAVTGVGFDEPSISTYFVNGCVVGGGACTVMIVSSGGGGGGSGTSTNTNTNTGGGGTSTGGGGTSTSETGSGGTGGTTATVIPVIPPAPVPVAPPVIVTPEAVEESATTVSNIATATPVVTGVAGIVGQISAGSIATDDAPGTATTTGAVGQEEPGQTRSTQRGVPLVNPLGEMSQAPLRKRSADPDLVVPNVSERDY